MGGVQVEEPKAFYQNPYILRDGVIYGTTLKDVMGFRSGLEENRPRQVYKLLALMSQY